MEKSNRTVQMNYINDLISQRKRVFSWLYTRCFQRSRRP